MNVAPGDTYDAVIDWGATGATLGMRVLDNEGATTVARVTGFAELVAGSGVYALTGNLAPADIGQYTLLYDDDGGTAALGHIATDDLTISSAADQSATLDAIKAKTDLINGGTVITITAPVLESGNISLVQGDDYKTTDGRALQWSSTSWPVITAGTISLQMVPTSGGTQQNFTGAVVSASAAKVELTATQTAGLSAGSWRYDLKVTLSNSDVVTLATGAVIVSSRP